MDGTSPETTHDLLLALAGRVDDDLLAWTRELVAVGEDAHAIALLTATLVADRVALPAPVRSALVDASRYAHTELDADAALPTARPDNGISHRFTPPAAGDPVAGALLGLPARQLQGCEVLLTRRVTPAGAASGPLPHPVVLVRATAGRPGDVLAYQLSVALDRAGVRASVEVLPADVPVPAYHVTALSTAVVVRGQGPVATGRPDQDDGEPDESRLRLAASPFAETPFPRGSGRSGRSGRVPRTGSARPGVAGPGVAGPGVTDETGPVRAGRLDPGDLAARDLDGHELDGPELDRDGLGGDPVGPAVFDVSEPDPPGSDRRESDRPESDPGVADPGVADLDAADARGTGDEVGAWEFEDAEQHGAEPHYAQRTSTEHRSIEHVSIEHGRAGLDEAEPDGAELDQADAEWADVERADVGRSAVGRVDIDSDDVGRADVGGSDLAGHDPAEKDIVGQGPDADLAALRVGSGRAPEPAAGGPDDPAARQDWSEAWRVTPSSLQPRRGFGEPSPIRPLLDPDMTHPSARPVSEERSWPAAVSPINRQSGPIPLVRRVSPPNRATDDDRPAETPAIAALSDPLNDPLNGPLEQPLLAPLLDLAPRVDDSLGVSHELSPDGPAHDSWASEWLSGDWAMPSTETHQPPPRDVTAHAVDEPDSGPAPRRSARHRYIADADDRASAAGAESEHRLATGPMHDGPIPDGIEDADVPDGRLGDQERAPRRVGHPQGTSGPSEQRGRGLPEQRVPQSGYRQDGLQRLPQGGGRPSGTTEQSQPHTAQIRSAPRSDAAPDSAGPPDPRESRPAAPEHAQDRRSDRPRNGNSADHPPRPAQPVHSAPIGRPEDLGLRAESVDRLSAADRGLLARLQAELLQGRRPWTIRRAGIRGTPDNGSTDPGGTANRANGSGVSDTGSNGSATHDSATHDTGPSGRGPSGRGSDANPHAGGLFDPPDLAG